MLTFPAVGSSLTGAQAGLEQCGDFMFQVDIEEQVLSVSECLGIKYENVFTPGQCGVHLLSFQILS